MNKAATPFMTAEDFKDRIENPFYQQRVKSLTEVIRTSYNANGDVTEDKQDTAVVKYTVKVLKRLDGNSFSGI